ncbi:sensor histidine kinase [Paenibacillus aceris]|uniref:histidine kinase n=1 Tax=Paenibacillus aceris TaxID=869555 RepID=A0ABS4IBE1_9BACL|nr:HAMP domain-containing sensor histidine kinase [Paenibacillus aceris]MBP1967796.1 two-component system sporulation sensor kinase B [Paenibacillus aceris]NHW39056.1 HAMP domain-containing histidine kinase [Paenibacillus aceris]
MRFNYDLSKFLLNILFIMFPLIFYQFTIQEKMNETKALKNIIIFFLFATPMILCMYFPPVEETSLIFDLRIIPLIIGCLYGNSITSILLFVSLIVVRFMIGGSGAYLNLISSTLSFVVIITFSKRYHSFSLMNKILSSFLLSFICKMIGISSILIIDSDYDLLSAFEFYIVQSLFMGLAIYIIESIRRNAELKKELIFSEKMNVASVISASVAHEIRNPLTAVRGFLQLLTQTDLKPDKKQMYGEICLAEIDRAEQIINDYLSLAKPYPEVVEKLDIGEEIQYICNILTPLANLTGAEIQVKQDYQLFVSGDRQKLRQSIINIAKNGIEAMADKSGVLKIEAYRRNNEVILSISDTGIGMTNDQINRLGMPYYSNKDKGTGLGMMVSFGFIKGMLGNINVKSEVGKGTVFDIAFPLLKM